MHTVAGVKCSTLFGPRRWDLIDVEWGEMCPDLFQFVTFFLKTYAKFIQEYSKGVTN